MAALARLLPWAAWGTSLHPDPDRCPSASSTIPCRVTLPALSSVGMSPTQLQNSSSSYPPSSTQAHQSPALPPHAVPRTKTRPFIPPSPELSPALPSIFTPHSDILARSLPYPSAQNN